MSWCIVEVELPLATTSEPGQAPGLLLLMVLFSVALI